MSKQTFQRIALMGREGVEGLLETLNALKTYLLSLNHPIVIEESTAHFFKGVNNVSVVPSDQLNKHTDLLIVVGGDGSMLSASHIAVPQQLPVLGINRGRLGFLTDIHPNQLTKIQEILAGRYQEESRFLLKRTLDANSENIPTELALNDVVLLPGNVAKMIEFDVYIDQEFVCSQRADGLIVSTPTGSTAYALSGGGPILHPRLDAIVLVPMFPHTLSSRPIVVQGNSMIKIVISPNNDVIPHVSCDGLNRIDVPPGSTLHISKNDKQLRLIHPEDYNYYDTLRHKLDWEKRNTRV